MTTPVVLDEDTYTEAISLIIERDFFPNLAKLRAQQGYLEAQRNGTFTDLQEAGKALRQVDTDPLRTKRDAQQGINFYVENEPRIEKRVNLNLSLDQFQTLYTSEDNASFTDLLEKANVKIKEQNKWFFDRESKQLRLTDRPHESSPVQLIEAGDKSTLGWKYQARNSLMYFPQGKSESWVDQNEGRGQPKSIEHRNTHILTEQIVKKNTHHTVDQGSLMAWNQLNGLQRDNDNSSSTPRIRGFNLVDATPALSPTRMGTPEMTWGSIEGTPLLISHNNNNNNGSQTPGYSLPKISKREELGMKLSEKASKAYRKKTNERQRAIQGTPRSGAGLMSPAAQHLLRKSHKTPTQRAMSGFGEALRSTYSGSPSLGISTPKTIRRPGATPTPIGLFRAGITPQHSLGKKDQE